MINDFLNKSAKQLDEGLKLKDFLFVIMPSIVGLLSVVLNFWKFVFEDNPYLSYWIRAIVCFALFGLSLMLIISKKNIYNKSNSFLIHPNDSQELKYKLKQFSYSEGIRIFSKILFFPLILISCISIWNCLPCGLIQENYISGKIIDGISNNPKRDGFITVEGIAGDMISKKTEKLDDDGFFYCDLKWWASKPKYILLESSDCKTKRILLTDSKIYQTTPYKAAFWIISCSN